MTFDGEAAASIRLSDVAVPKHGYFAYRAYR
jgi:hypothetical protein